MHSVVVVGAGPAGLAFAISLARAGAGHRITVVDRRAVGDVHGYGVTLRAPSLAPLELGPLIQGPALEGRALWFRGAPLVDLPNPAAGHLVAMSRGELIRALVRRAEGLGVSLRWQTPADRVDPAEHDLVVAADGASSALRERLATTFAPSVTYGANHFAWLGTSRVFRKLTIMVRDEDVPMLAWAYQYAEDRSTLIVEVSQATFGRVQPTPADVARILAQELEGHPVLGSPGSVWPRFPTVRCAELVHENVVLIGDAAHTTHYSQGFGTLFAFDDAQVLSQALLEAPSIDEALSRYAHTQQPKVAEFQDTSTQSMHWAEAVVRAADVRDEAAIRAQVALRWPENAVTPGPLDPR